LSIDSTTLNQIGNEIIDTLPDELTMNPKLRIILAAVIGVELGILWLLKR